MVPLHTYIIYACVLFSGLFTKFETITSRPPCMDADKSKSQTIWRTKQRWIYTRDRLLISQNLDNKVICICICIQRGGAGKGNRVTELKCAIFICDPLWEKGSKVAGKFTRQREKTSPRGHFINLLFLICSHCRASVLSHTYCSQPILTYTWFENTFQITKMPTLTKAA